MDPSITQESLPKGWIVKTSRSQKGKEYFCNPSRKISLWSLPEVLAFERGLRQLENTSLSNKFKPVTSAADPKGKRPGAEGASQPTAPTVSANATCLQPQEKPFKMVLKATRKLSQTNSTLKDYIAEAASLCSFSGSTRKAGTSGKLSSGSSFTESSPVKDVIEKRKDGTSSPADRTLKSPKGRVSSKRTLSSIEKEEGTIDTQVKSGNSQKKVASEIRSSQLGCSTSKLLGKLFPGKVAKTSSKTAKETTSESAGIQENQIKERLKALNAMIDTQLNASKWNRASAKVQAATGTTQTTPAVPTSHVSPAPFLRQATGAASKAGKGVPAKQKPQQDEKSSRTHPQTDAEETDSGTCHFTSTSASALAKPTSTNGARKKLRASPTVSSGPQLYDHIPLPPANTTKKQKSSPGTVHQPPTQQTGTSLKHYTIPKRRSNSVPPADPAATAKPRPVDPSLVLPAPPPLPPSSPPPLPPLPPPPLSFLPPPPPPPPPCQPDAAAPVAVVPPFVPSVDTSASYSGVVAASGASADVASVPSWSDGLEEGPRWADGPVSVDQHRLLTEETIFRTEVGQPPAVEEGQEDELELMEWDEPDLNDDEVLSQIACLRGAGAVPWGHGTGPGPDAVPWGYGSAAAAAGSCGGEPAALLSGWSPQPAAPPTPAPAERLLTVVIDTNVLIHGVGFVLDLRDSFVEGLRPLLLIPWVVVQELDRLKQDDRRQPGQDVTVSSKARAAINFLLECFQARHPSVRGQTAAEAAAARGPLQGRVADDAILECCLAASQQSDVLLLSDDKNLLTKVLLHGLAGASRQQLLQATDLCGVTEDLQVTEENQNIFAKIILRKLLSYVIRREMSLAYGAAWHALPGVRRPWWSLRDLVSVVCGQRAVFRTVFACRWHHWQQIFKLATRPVLSAAEQCSLCAGVSELLPLLQPSDHYLPLVRPLSAALQTGAVLPAGPLAALGTSLGGQRTAVSHSDQQGDRQGGPDAPPAGQKTPSLADVIRQQNREAAEDRSGSAMAPGPRQNGRTPAEETADRTAAGTPPPPDDDDDAVMGLAGGPGELDPTAVLDLFQSVWNYVNTCCGLLLDAAGVPHPYQYERPAAPPTPDECAAFLPELGTAVQMLATTLKSLMGVSVVALASDDRPLVAACHALYAVVALAGQDIDLTPQQLLRFLRSPANRLLLGKGLEQLTGFLKTLEELHRMVS